jgi:O-methyltransferase
MLDSNRVNASASEATVRPNGENLHLLTSISAKGAAAMNVESNLNAAYLELLKRCLTRYIFPDPHRPLIRPFRAVHPLAWAVYPAVTAVLRTMGLKLYRYAKFDPAARAEGRDWPADADTMIGLKRLDNLQFCIEQVLRDGVPGHLIETGVWRGGACIFMRAALKAYGDSTREVWVADSFEGLPKPDGRYEEDEGDSHSLLNEYLGVPLDQVKANFARFELLDDRVRFLKGWFKDTLPTAPINKIAILRLDCDMYSSTMDSLQNLYPRVSAGGYVIVDDYGGIDACRRAVDDFRRTLEIQTPLIPIDWSGIYWRKLAE